jgi:predicted lipoprotein
MKRLLLLLLLLWPTAAGAAEYDFAGYNGDLREQRLIPWHQALDEAAADLAAAVATQCEAPSPPALTAAQAAFHATTDAWMRLQWLKHGPARENDRAQRLDYWPDPRGSVGKQLGRLLAAPRDDLLERATLAGASTALQGLPALERLLFDDGDVTGYRCRLAAAIAANVRTLAGELLAGWSRADALAHWAPGGDATQFANEIYRDLLGHLQAIGLIKLVGPYGEKGRARPALAEMWRSGRAIRNMRINLEAMGTVLSQPIEGGLAELVPDDGYVQEDMQAALSEAREALTWIEGAPAETLSGKAGKQRWRAAIDAVGALYLATKERLGPGLGFEAGFNALDGD